MATKGRAAGTVYTTPSEREVRIAREFAAPQRQVFAAWSEPEHVRKWMLGPDGWSMPVCEMDLRAGGKWRFVWRRTDGTEMEMEGEYREVAAPDRLVWTEAWGGDWPETLNTLVLTEEEGRTLMSLTMLYPSKEARDAALETGMKEGMSRSMERLEAHLQAM